MIEEETGRDLGPYASPRIVFQVGETLARRPAERYQITKVIPAKADEPPRPPDRSGRSRG